MDWALKPAELGPGDTFRLLFVTSTSIRINSDDIDTYNRFVQDRAAAGHEAIRSYSSHFRVVASTTAVDARDNTRSNGARDGPGEPIYWLGSRVKLAADYADFYDGQWDSQSWTTEAGGTGSNERVRFLNGSKEDGRIKPGRGFRNITRQHERVGGGALNSPGATVMYSLDGTADANGRLSGRVYALSGVFRVAPDTRGPGGLYVADTTVVEGQPAPFVVTMDGALTTAATVDYATSDRSAIAESDYHAVSGTLTFAQGETSKTVSVTTVGDDIREHTENFRLTLSNPSDNARLSDPIAIGTIYRPRFTAKFLDVPLSHGRKPFRFELRFSEDPGPHLRHRDLLGEDSGLPGPLAVSGGDLRQVRRIVKGANQRWRILVRPDGGGDVRVALRGVDCASPVAICAFDGRRLAERVEARVPQGAEEAEFSGLPVAHAGEPFTFTLEFGAEIRGSAESLGEALTVNGGTVTGLAPAVAGQSREWSVTVTPAAAPDVVTVRLTPGDSCAAAGGICTVDGRRLTAVLEAEVRGAATTLSVADATAEEDAGAVAEFVVTLEPAAIETVTVDYATGDGSATAGSDYTSRAGTLTFRPGETSNTVSVPVLDDTVMEDRETFTLTLDNPSGGYASLADATATGQIDSDEVHPPLTAEFRTLPESHGGATFTFEVHFSEDPGSHFSYTTLRGSGGRPGAISVTGGRLDSAWRLSPPRNDGWGVRIIPDDGETALSISLPATSSCTSRLAICTANGRPLSAAVEAQVAAGTGSPGQEPDVTPLTVRLEQVPTEHDGESSVTFRVYFSENLYKYSYLTLLNETLSLRQNGQAVASREVERLNKPYNDAWRVTFTPGSNADVAVSIEPTTSCTEPGAACTEDGRMLSNEVSATIPGPPGLSINDATVTEGLDVTVDFVVRLSRSVAEQVTVDYQTRDKSATAGSDYTAMSGTLTFAPGETTHTVSVPVLDDNIDEDSEFFGMRLSNARGGNVYISDRWANGRITNDDPMPHAWLARFGRTLAVQAVATIGGRLRGDGGTHVTLGGRALDVAGTSTTQEENESALAALAETPPATTLAMTGRELLLGSSFHLSTGGAAGGEPDATAVTAWGRFATGWFSANEDGARMDGTVTVGFLGADVARGRLLAGLAVGLTEAEGGYASTATGSGGATESTMTTLYPYGRVSVTEQFDVWGLAGFGFGDLDMTHEREGGPEERFETGITVWMGAIGARGELLPPVAADGFSLAVKSDAFWVHTRSEAVRAQPGVHGNLAGAEVDAHRSRFIMEGSRSFAVGAGRLTPLLEIGLRHDGGDAETGTGIEAGAALRYATGGVSVDGSVRALLVHESDGFAEWGASGAVSVGPDPSGLGLSLTLAPAWGAASSGVERLWRMSEPSVLPLERGFEATPSVDAEIGYGLGLGRLPGVVTPYAGLFLDEGRAWRTGARWAIAPGASLAVEGTWSEGAADGARPAPTLKLLGSFRW